MRGIENPVVGLDEEPGVIDGLDRFVGRLRLDGYAQVRGTRSLYLRTVLLGDATHFDDSHGVLLQLVLAQGLLLLRDMQSRRRRGSDR